MTKQPFNYTGTILCMLLPLFGCMSYLSKKESATSTVVYSRSIAPFLVYDQKSQKIDYPFLGGLNTPRPQFVDIDADNDPDLFVQEHSNELMFFEFIHEGEIASLKWRTNTYKDLKIGEWFRFVDMDQDGDFDLLTEKKFSYISYYQNIGTAKFPTFILAADSLKDANGIPIYSDRQNIPNVTDIDANGMPDLFIGSLEGTVSRYESIGNDESGIPRFKLVTHRFEDIEIVTQFGTLHGANTMTFMDIDADGDEDIFWGDFFEPGVLLIENTGNKQSPNFRNQPQPFPTHKPAKTSGYNAPALVDWGNDGDADFFIGVLGGAYNANVTSAANFYFYEQEDGIFAQKTQQFLRTIDVGEESIVTTGDVDGDGDLDFLVANKIDATDLKSAAVYMFDNRGTPNKPVYYNLGSIALPKSFHFAPELVDLNNDGTDDLLIGNWKGEISYYTNTGCDFGLQNAIVAKLPKGSHATPRAIDLDADGDFDLVSGSSGGNLYLFENTGTINNPKFELKKDAFKGIKSKHRSAPTFSDMDNDGDYDLFVGSKIQGILYFENIGSSENATFVSSRLPLKIATSPMSNPHATDLDGDGVDEFLIGSRSGGLLYYHRKYK